MISALTLFFIILVMVIIFNKPFDNELSNSWKTRITQYLNFALIAQFLILINEIFDKIS